MPPNCHVVIRRMFETDIPAANDLIRPQRWNQTDDDWRRFMALEPDGCFVAVADGRVLATTTTALFDAVGWIGMVTVAPERRGSGIGRAMMARAVSYLRCAGARTVKLDATPMGKPLYDRMGFRSEYRLERGVATGRRLSSDGVVACAGGELPLIEGLLALDRRAYRVDRARMLRGLMAAWPELAAVHLSGGRPDGYIVGRHGVHYEHLGPLVAETPAAAEALLRWGLSRAEGRQVICDRPDPNEPACDLMRAYGFEPLREFTRMHLGQEPYLDRPEMIYSSSGAEKG